MNPVYKNIAIIGGGPAASALAIRLCQAGCKVVIYATPERAPILVGESLVPMIVPMLQALGVEEEVAAYSVYKPGACFTYNAEEVFEFRFADTPSDMPSYSYNVPRVQFNATLLSAAQRAGTQVIAQTVQLSTLGDSGKITLDEAALDAATGCWDERTPDLIVDAAGRINLIGRLLNIPMQKGPRQDIALFAHVDQTELVDPGYVHNDRIGQGWCWRIPLPGRVSFGFVVPEAYAQQQGDSPETQYDQLLQNDAVLRRLAPTAKRVTPVLRFSNYQSLSDKLCGDNWVMLGDAGGFVDPVFSSGMLIALESANLLAEIILSQQALSNYEKITQAHLKAWFEIVSYYYDGRLMGSIKAGQMMPNNVFTRSLLAWVSGHCSRVFSGAMANHPFSLKLLRFVVTYGMTGRDPAIYQIK